MWKASPQIMLIWDQVQYIKMTKIFCQYIQVMHAYIDRCNVWWLVIDTTWLVDAWEDVLYESDRVVCVCAPYLSIHSELLLLSPCTLWARQIWVELVILSSHIWHTHDFFFSLFEISQKFSVLAGHFWNWWVFQR